MILLVQFFQIYQYYLAEKENLKLVAEIDNQAYRLREYQVLKRQAEDYADMVKLIQLAATRDDVPVIMSKLRNEVERRYLEAERENLGHGVIFATLTTFKILAKDWRIDFKIKIYSKLTQTSATELELGGIFREMLDKAFDSVKSLSDDRKQVDFTIEEKHTAYIIRVTSTSTEKEILITDELRTQVEELNGKFIEQEKGIAFLLGKTDKMGRPLLRVTSGGEANDHRKDQ